MATQAYNERLFSGGFRSYLHFARFRWVQEQIAGFGASTASVLELGCFDARLLDFIPRPERYVGLDANWEGGLDLARAKYGRIAGYEFHRINNPAEVEVLGQERFDLTVCLETLEHIEPTLVDDYLAALSRHTRGLLIATVPNEIGLVFIGKWAAKFLLRMQPERYTFSEIWNATIGRTERVGRREHKGFNYRDMVRSIEKHFTVLKVEGFPLRALHRSLCFGVGIVARRRA